MSTRKIGRAPQPWNIDVSQLLIDGHAPLDKFGRNDGVTGDDTRQTICEGCDGLYQYNALHDPQTLYISSSDAGDNQILIVDGLDDVGNAYKQEKQLSGQTAVQLDDTMTRVSRMEQKDLNTYSETDFAGTIYCYTVGTNVAGVPSGGSVTKAQINNGNNKTLMMLLTIPLGKVGFLYRGEIGMQFEGGAFSGTENCEVHYRSRRAGSVFKTQKSVDVSSDGNSIYQDERSFPDIIPALTDVELTKVNASAACSMWGTLDVLLVDESEFNAEFLSLIGQPSAIPGPS